MQYFIAFNFAGSPVPEVPVRVDIPPGVGPDAGQPHQHLNTVRESAERLRQVDEEGGGQQMILQ